MALLEKEFYNIAILEINDIQYSVLYSVGLML